MLRRLLPIAVLGLLGASAALAAEPKISETQPATIFGMPAKGSKFVFVFDRSSSMSVPEGKPLKAAKAELIASIAQLKEEQQFYMVIYNHEPRLLDVTGVKGRSVYGNAANKTTATKLIEGITADGATRHESALAMALKMRPDVIFLLTDGDADDDLTAEELERLGRINTGASVINVIQFSKPSKSNRLVTLAKESAGEHIYVDLLKFKREK